MTSQRHFLFSIVYCFAFAMSAAADTVTVFAAASLKTALDDIVEEMPVTVSYAASSTIARQVELGAPADIIMTANVVWMDYLQDVGRIESSTRRDLAGNELVLVAPSDMDFSAQANHDLDTVIGNDRLAMALVNAVPAGIYGKEALMSLGLWDALALRVVQTDNVRAALRLVAIGEVPFGIVYATDALSEPRVQIIHRFDPSLHDEILYPIAIVSGQDRPEVRTLWTHLQSDQAAATFVRHGFVPIGSTP